MHFEKVVKMKGKMQQKSAKMHFVLKNYM